MVQFAGSSVHEGDYATWISLEYVRQHPGTECDEARNTTVFSITNQWANSIDGDWDGTVADHGGKVQAREEPPGSGKYSLLSDLVLINEGEDTSQPFGTDLSQHQPAGTYLLCLSSIHNMTDAEVDGPVEDAIEGEEMRRRLAASSAVATRFYANVYLVVHQSPPTAPPSPEAPPAPSLPPLKPPPPPPNEPPSPLPPVLPTAKPAPACAAK